MAADGSDLVRVTTGNVNGIPAWSPDGRQLAIMSTRDFNAEVYLVNTDGSGATRLTNNALPGNTLPEDFFPDWQPVATAQAAGSLALDGVTGYAEAASAPDLNRTGDWTIETWFKDESPQGFNHDYVTLISKGDIAAANGRESPYFITLGFKRLLVGLRSNFENYSIGYDLRAGAVDPAKWHQVAASFQSSSRTLTIYLDGTRVGSGQLGSASAGNNLPVQLGRNGPLSGKYFRGKVDDARIWNRVRTPSEIASMYATQLDGPQPGLVANWHFDERGGDVAVDSSGNHHDAILTGGAAFDSLVPTSHSASGS